MEGRKSAIGRWVGLGVGRAEGVGEAAVGFFVTFAWAWTVLPAEGAPSAVGVCDVAATAGTVELEVCPAVDRVCLLTDAVGVAAPVGEAAERVAVGLDAAVVAVDAPWPLAAVVGWPAGLALAVGVSWLVDDGAWVLGA
jgi:hypothetical protein